jgi:hypothetical protein
MLQEFFLRLFSVTLIQLAIILSIGCASSKKENTTFYQNGYEAAQRQIAKGKMVLNIGSFFYSKKELLVVLKKNYDVNVVDDSNWNQDYSTGFSVCMRKFLSKKYGQDWWVVALEQAKLEPPPPID